jgi:hypothetical protein
MLIKILSRKNNSFGKLMNYISKEADSQTLCYNLPQTDELNILQQEFIQNNAYRSKGAKNNMYHHILSFSSKDKAVITPEILHDVALHYINKAGLENHLVYGRVHTDRENLHWHLMSSQNSFHNKKGFRLSKSELKALQVEMEEYTKEYYPQIKHSFAYTTNKRNLTLGLETSKAVIKPTEQEFQIAKLGRITEKEKLIDHLKAIAKASSTTLEFENRITQDSKYELYRYRDKIHGIVDKEQNKKYRLTTLFKTKELATIYRMLQSKDKQVEQQREQQR